MNIIYLGFCWGDAVILIGGVLFCVTHALLSSLFFYLVDCIQRRYNSRSTVDVSGILQTTPSLGVAILISVFLYGAFPGSLKFMCELYIFSGLFDLDLTGAIFLIYTANFLGYIGFSKC